MIVETSYNITLQFYEFQQQKSFYNNSYRN